jgi:hypothetical protein
VIQDLYESDEEAHMGGFLGDLAKPLLKSTGIGAIPAVNKALRPATSHERTLEKQSVAEEENRQKLQLLSQQQRIQESERRYWLPENIRRRAGVANQEAEAGKARQTASQYLGG